MKLPKIMQKRTGYTEQVLAAKWNTWTGNDYTIGQVAAVEFGVEAYARAFMSAKVEPRMPALTREYLASIVRDLIVTGNHLSVIDAEMGMITLRRAYSWDIKGSWRPSSWVYNVSVSGPTRSLTRNFGSESVIHIRLNAPANRPWEGTSPLANCPLTSNLLARIERALSDEMGGAIANLVYVPAAESTEHRDAIGTALATARGAVVVQQGGKQVYAQPNQNAGNIQVNRIGANPPPANIDLRGQAESAILAAMGVPAGLYVPKEGAVSREAYRQFIYGSVQPIGKLVADELSLKLEEEISLNFESIAAADVAARARAYHILKQAEMPEEQILEVIGYD